MDPDLELLQRWRDGDRSAGDDLLARYFDGLRIYFVQRISESEPEDLIQEVFVRMVEARDRFEGRSTLRTYVFHIARYVFHETLRAILRPNGTFDPASESIADVNARSGTSRAASNERSQVLADTLRTLPIETQDLLELHYWHDLTIPELAEYFGAPEGTIKSRLGAARKRLKGLLDPTLMDDLTKSRKLRRPDEPDEPDEPD